MLPLEPLKVFEDFPNEIVPHIVAKVHGFFGEFAHNLAILVHDLIPVCFLRR